MGQDQLNLLTDWVNKYLRRAFTVRSDEIEPTEILSLHKDHLYHMRNEFEESYQELFNESFQSLHKAMSIKLHAIEKCQEKLESWIKDKSDKKGDLSYKFRVLTTEEVKLMTVTKIKRKYKFIE